MRRAARSGALRPQSQDRLVAASRAAPSATLVDVRDVNGARNFRRRSTAGTTGTAAASPPRRSETLPLAAGPSPGTRFLRRLRDAPIRPFLFFADHLGGQHPSCQTTSCTQRNLSTQAERLTGNGIEWDVTPYNPIDQHGGVPQVLMG